MASGSWSIKIMPTIKPNKSKEIIDKNTKILEEKEKSILKKQEHLLKLLIMLTLFHGSFSIFEIY